MPAEYDIPSEGLADTVQRMYDAGYELETAGEVKCELTGTGLDAEWRAEIRLHSPRLNRTYTGTGTHPRRFSGKYDLGKSIAIHKAQGMVFRTHVAHYMRVTGDDLLPDRSKPDNDVCGYCHHPDCPMRAPARRLEAGGADQ